MQDIVKERMEEPVILKGLSRYDIYTSAGSLVVKKRSTRKELRGSICQNGEKVYALKGDDGKVRRYRFRVLLFYLRNRKIPALVSGLYRYGISLHPDGSVNSDVRRATSCNTFTSIQEAMETLMVVKSWQDGEKASVLLWMRDARKNALNLCGRYGWCGRRRAEQCIPMAEEMFMNQLDNFRVRRVMPLFGMYCKCLKITIKDRKTEILCKRL